MAVGPSTRFDTLRGDVLGVFAVLTPPLTENKLTFLRRASPGAE